MLIKIKTSVDIPSSDITPEPIYRSRRDFMRLSVAGTIGAVAGAKWLAGRDAGSAAFAQGAALPTIKSTSYVTADEKANTYEQITSYNNYYEFGTRKSDPVNYAGALKVTPWSVKVDGLVDKPGNYGVEDLVDFKQLEERIYRHRCVEAWSMVIPWIGVPLSSVLNKVKPNSKAKFVEFTTLQRPSEMPGLRADPIPWPYLEGLRMDEAMHPLALMVVGLYGKVLPNQNGAPLRVHIPWKYGFKSGKSIVRIRFTDTQPKTAWNEERPEEYGFYANVNPTVDHPRWSQAREVRLPGLLKNRPTLMFNGYADQVGKLYEGMDLKKYY